MALISCTNCGAKLTTKVPVAPGKKMKCPKCAKVFVVAEEEEQAEEEPAAGKPEVRAEENQKDAAKENTKPKKSAKSAKAARKGDAEQVDGYDEVEAEKPANKKKGEPKKKSSLGPVLGVIGVLLLCCCVGTGGTGWYFKDKVNIVRYFGLEGVLGKNKDKGAGRDNLAQDDKGKDANKGKLKDDAKDKNSAKDNGQKPDPSKPVFVGTAEQFCEELNNDRDAAHKKYFVKTVEITGEVGLVSIHRNPFTRNNELSVFLRGPAIKGKKGNYRLSVKVDKAQWPETYRLSSGQKIKVVGRYSNSVDGWVDLGSGNITEVTKSEIREIAAADLAADFEKSPTEADKKYRGEILISGQLVEYKKNPIAGFAAKFKGTDKTSVEFFAGDIDSGEIERLKVGGIFVARTTKCQYEAFRNKVNLENVIVTSLKASKTSVPPENK